MMRALTLTQPWAGLVASGLKRIENRPRSILRQEYFPQPFAIHASREIDELVYEQIMTHGRTFADLWVGWEADDAATWPAWYRLSRITSAVIGVAKVARMIDMTRPNPDRNDGRWITDREHGDATFGDQSRWAFGPICYVLRDIVALPTPVPCRGFQGFWTLPPDVEAAVLAQQAPSCPYGNMPREAGAGHWRDWHRGHGCHLDQSNAEKGER